MVSYFRKLVAGSALAGSTELNLETLSLVASKTDNAVIITDQRGSIEWVNEGFERISGYSSEEVIGKNPGVLLQGPDTDPETVARIGSKLALREPVKEEILNYTKDGRPYWLSISINPVFDEAGMLVRFIAIEADITERKETESQMRLLSLVAQETDNAVIIGSKAGVVEWVNAGFTRISGYTLAEVKGKKPGHILQGPGTNPDHVAAIRQKLATKQSFRQEILNYAKGGRPYWLQLSITPVLNAQGEVERFIAIELDITEQKRQEALLQETLGQLTASEEELRQQAEEINAINEELELKTRQVQEQMEKMRARDEKLKLLSLVASKTDNAVIITDAKGKIEWVNPGFTRITGYNPNEVLGKNPGILLQGPDTDPADVERLRRGLGSLTSFKAEILNYSRDQTPYWIELSITPVLNDMGEAEKFVAIEMDITERKKAEQRLNELMAQLRDKNEELVASEEETRQLADQLYASNQRLQEHNQNMTDSIQYASRIQSALLPPLAELQLATADSFILNRPKDIVSGDFYWWSQTPNALLLAVGDCTGHGVPGAMMSMLAHALLDRVLQANPAATPVQMLTELDTLLRNSLGSGTQNVNDGMDVAIVLLNPALGTLNVAAANRPVWLQQADGIREIEATRRSVGPQVLAAQSQVRFTEQTLAVSPGNRVFLFSDGITDQMGGDRMRKLGKPKILEIINANAEAPMAKVKENIEAVLAEWQTNGGQTDDMVMLGFQI